MGDLGDDGRDAVPVAMSFDAPPPAFDIDLDVPRNAVERS
jgi:hypothetical protein